MKKRILGLLLIPAPEASLRLVTVACLCVALAMLGLVVYQGHVIAEQKEFIDWFERTFMHARTM